MPILGASASGAKSSPVAPTIGTATNVGTSRAYNNGAASVTFTAPTSKLPISSYTVTSSPGGYTGTGASSPITVAGLQSATAYTFTVTATSAVGTSAASAASNSITATTVPQAPTIGAATAGNASATVAYTANATGGAAVSTFTATSSPSSITGTGASPITVSGLSNGTAYTFTVTATNANGTSTASSASGSITPVVPFAFNSISSYSTPTTPTAWGTLTPGGSFNSIPQTYRHLQFRISAQSNTDSMPDQWYFYINGDFSNRLSQQAIESLNGGNPSPNGDALNRTNKIEVLATGNTSANYRDTHIFTHFNYSDTSKRKIVRYEYFSTNPAGTNVRMRETTWINTSTSAISSFQFGSSLGDPVAGCTFALYGIS